MVYFAGAGPVGLATAASCHLLGAACVIVGNKIPEQLEQAHSFGCEVVDIGRDATVAEQIAEILDEPKVECVIDCVGFEAGGSTSGAVTEVPASVLNISMEVCKAGGQIGIPGLYVTGDPGAVDAPAKEGYLSVRIGLAGPRAAPSPLASVR